MILKILLYVLLSIIGLIALISVFKVSITVVYRDRLELFVGIGFFRINILRKKKQRKAKKLSLAKSLEEKEKKRTKKQKKAKNAKKARSKNQTVSDGSLVESVKSNLGLITELVLKLITDFSGYLKIKLCRIFITVATTDAAKTAIEYGSILSAVNALYAVLENIDNFSVCEKNVLVKADFMTEKSVFDIKIKLSIFVWQVYACAFRALKHYLGERKDVK